MSSSNLSRGFRDAQERLKKFQAVFMSISGSFYRVSSMFHAISRSFKSFFFGFGRLRETQGRFRGKFMKFE